MRRFSSLTLLLLTMGVAVFTREQQPPPTEPPGQARSEHEQLEEEYMRSRAENGESHASGARPDLGPVVLGNPTTAVVALRVGLYATTFTATGAVACLRKDQALNEIVGAIRAAAIQENPPWT